MTLHERERLSAWLDGELSPNERAEVEAHLAACEECAALLAEMGAVDALARELPVEAPAGYFETFPAAVRSRIERPAPARSPAAPRRWRMPVWTWAAAAVLLLAVVTPLTLERASPPEAPPARDLLAPAPPAAEPVDALSEAQENGEEDEGATAADQDRPGKREKQAAERERRVEERAGEPPPVLAAAPPPAPAPKIRGAATSGPRASAARGREATTRAGPAPAPPDERAAGRWADAPALEAQVPAHREGPAVEETRVAEPELRRPPAKDDEALPDAAAAPAPAEGYAVIPQAAQPVGLASAEKKAVGEDVLAFARLARRTPSDAVGWRELREAWRAFVEAHPGSRHADEARVRIIEAGLEAWRAGGDPDDLTRARADAEAYLARDDARQAERIRRALETAPESPR